MASSSATFVMVLLLLQLSSHLNHSAEVFVIPSSNALKNTFQRAR